MRVNIRLMQLDDWQDVAEINNLAFDAYYSKTNRPLSNGKRTKENIHAAFAMFPHGCFVVEEAGKTQGFIFCRHWGKQGWIGVFGVDPRAHGKGMGKQLLSAAIAALQAAGCASIGLETMPDSPYNVGLYLQMGFSPVYNTLYMCKEVNPKIVAEPCSTLNRVDLSKGLEEITKLCHAANPFVDYVSEAQNALAYQWGDVLLPGWPDPWGFALVRTKHVRDSYMLPVCDMVAVVLPEVNRARFPEMLQIIEQYAIDMDAAQIVLPVYTQEPSALQQVLDYGFRVSRINVRMVMNPPYTQTPGLDLNRWTM